MSWNTTDGHEGYVTPLFADGKMGGSTSAEGVSATTAADGRMLPFDAWETRPGSAIVGWVVACNCPEDRNRQGWQGFRWTRVATQAEEDVFAGRLYVADEDAAYIEDVREDVEGIARASWRGHAERGELLQDVSDALQAVGYVVRTARAGGCSWEEIGRAAGITAAEAERRWKRGDDLPAVGWVAGQALRWAKGDAWEQWVNAASDGPSSIGETVEAYLEQHDPFPEGMSVEVASRDEPGTWEPATIVERVGPDEWSVEYDAGEQAWRDHTELRPRS